MRMGSHLFAEIKKWNVVADLLLMELKCLSLRWIPPPSAEGGKMWFYPAAVGALISIILVL